MRLYREVSEASRRQELGGLAIGGIAGLAIGVLLSRLLRQPRRLGSELRERAATATRRLRPVRLRRLAAEQAELDRLSDAVLSSFLGDPVLRERSVDIGAISPGIVELSGSVWADVEAQRAVRLANSVPGVRTVVNRLDIERDLRGGSLRRSLDDDDLEATFSRHEGRVGGMGRRRQSLRTEPPRPDDSQQRREEALAAADRDQFAEEGLTGKDLSSDTPRPGEGATPTNFAEDELDNQDPHGKHAEYTLDSPPQELNSDSRVGEGEKPGAGVRLEGADLPVEEPPPRDRDD
jgi:hypothetical protein